MNCHTEIIIIHNYPYSYWHSYSFISTSHHSHPCLWCSETQQKLDLSKLPNVFVQFQKCICPIPKMYLCMQVTPTCDPAKPGSPNDVAWPYRHQTLQPAVQQVLQEYVSSSVHIFHRIQNTFFRIRLSAFVMLQFKIDQTIPSEALSVVDQLDTASKIGSKAGFIFLKLPF